MEAWLAISKEGTLWLKAGEALLRLYAAAAAKPATKNSLAAGPGALPAALLSLVQGPGIDLAAAWKLLAEEVGQPELTKFAPLLNPLPANAASIEWPILKGDVTTDTKAAGIGISLKGGAEASLEFVGGANAPADGIASGVSAPANERFLRISVNGAISGSAAAKAPINIGSIGVETAADAEAHLSYLTHHPKGSIFAEAVLESLAHLRSPFRLASALDFLNAFPSGAVLLDTSAGLKFALNVALAAPFNVGVPGTASVAIAAKARVRGAYNIVLISAVPNLVRLALQRKKVAGQELGATIKLDLDLSAITAQVKAAIRQAKDVSAKVDGFIAKLDPYFTPGTLLKGKIQSLVADLVEDKDAKELVSQALGFGAEGEPAGVLTKLIEDQINALDTLWDAKQQDVVKKLTANITDAMDIPGAGEALAGELAPRLNKLLDGLQDDLRDHITKLVTDNKVFESLKSALNDLGSNIQGVFDTIDERAAALLGPVRERLANFQQTVHSLLEEIDWYVNDALQVEIALLKSKNVALTLDLDLTFDTSKPDAAALYESVFFDDFVTVLSRIRKAPAGVVKVQKTGFTQYVERLSSSAIKVVFGKFEFTAGAVLKSSVKFETNDGVITGAEVRGDIDKNDKSGDMRERVVLVSSQRLREGHAQQITLDISVSRTNGASSRSDVAAFFRPLTAQLAPAAAVEWADAQWYEWCAAPGVHAIPSTLSVTRSLSDDELMTLLQLTRDGNGIAREAAKFNPLLVHRAGAAALQVTLFDPNKAAGKGARRLFEGLRKRNVPVPGNDVQSGLLWAMNNPIDQAIIQYAVKLPVAALDHVDRTMRAARMLLELPKAINSMRQIVISKPVAGDHAKPGEMTMEDASRWGQKVVDNLNQWVRTDRSTTENPFGWGDNSDIDPAMVAFFLVLKDLAKPGKLTLSMELLDRDTLKPRDPRTIARMNV